MNPLHRHLTDKGRMFVAILIAVVAGLVLTGLIFSTGRFGPSPG